MARPLKAGFKYFPLDVELDEKFELLEAEYGLKGFGVVIKLFQRIYKTEGYFTNWNNDVGLMFSRKVAESSSLVSEIVKCAIKRGIFDNDIFANKGVLTSRGIQKQFVEMSRLTKRKNAVINPEYQLFFPCEIPENSEETDENSEETPQNSRENSTNKNNTKSNPNPNKNNQDVSKKESKAGGYARKSYDELIKDFAFYFLDDDDENYLIEYERCEHLEQALKEFVQMRASKSLLTNAGLEELFLQLDGYDTKNKIVMVKKATASGWTGFFPVKEIKHEEDL